MAHVFYQPFLKQERNGFRSMSEEVHFNQILFPKKAVVCILRSKTSELSIILNSSL